MMCAGIRARAPLLAGGAAARRCLPGLRAASLAAPLCRGLAPLGRFPPFASSGPSGLRTAFSSEDGIFEITMLGDSKDEKMSWGTQVQEHRITPTAVVGLNAALDEALATPSAKSVLLRGEGRFFSNGFDLLWMDANGEKCDALQADTERLLARVLGFPMPTVACLNGHCTAAGAMLALAFDKRVMRSDLGWFFVPGIDIGLVYSPGMTQLMRAKLPVPMQSDVLTFGQRYQAEELVQLGVVKAAVKGETEVHSRARELALEVGPKGKHREAMRGIKACLYAEAIAALESPDKGGGMGFVSRDGAGKSDKPST
ncbi:unnamed protein product [Polarella glacialis]|uniref:3-hydroxyisobutyryl-CoA hydrolase n=1 Tax=Polarella glacialis TaxID=89957 RepID=A0A813JN49_POLGL|nr:unnamed protein product [Polarella glacialis]